MTILDRYLRAVEFWLPRAQRDDVIAELTDDLRSQIEDREAELGRPLAEPELGALLARRGNPAVTAARFLPQQYLIGPEVYPIYRFVLKMLALFYLLPAAVVGVTLLVVNATVRPVVPGLTPWGLLDYLWTWGIHAFAIVTVGFALLQRSSVRERLAGLGRRRDPFHASRFDSVAEVVFSVVMVGLGSRLLSGVDLGEARIALAPAAGPFFWPALLLFALSAVHAAARTVRPRWTPAGARVRLATTVALLVVFAGMLAASLFGVDVVSIAIPGATAEQAARVQRWANATAWLTMVIGLMINVWQDTVRIRRLRDAASTGGAAEPPTANRSVASANAR
ncbi:MAG TPA: hypothetical protein VGO40_18695 [Longimicrobium sp.]|jgi:hypothetical protein|nr:hypothetical protein [Longimicrobium sp.]